MRRKAVPDSYIVVRLGSTVVSGRKKTVKAATEPEFYQVGTYLPDKRVFSLNSSIM
jgi:hypothetical protein